MLRQKTAGVAANPGGGGIGGAGITQGGTGDPGKHGKTLSPGKGGQIYVNGKQLPPV